MKLIKLKIELLKQMFILSFQNKFIHGDREMIGLGFSDFQFHRISS